MYLGILFYFNGKFVQTQKRLSDQGRKAVFGLLNKIQDDCYNHETLLSLFDTYVIIFREFYSTISVHHLA
jgi:hypothetical protein